MDTPTWGVWVMWAGTLTGLILLTLELNRRGWPPPLSK